MDAAPVRLLDLQRPHLAVGEGRRLQAQVAIEPIDYAGERYCAEPEAVPVELEVSRIGGPGYALRLSFAAALAGPCMRCLGPARPTVVVDAREVSVPGGDEDLTSPYVDGDLLDLQSWARECVVLDMPAKVLCGEQCKGLCPICSANLNEAPAGHHHEAQGDPRWAKLRELP